MVGASHAAQVAAKELRISSETALGATKLLLPAISTDDPGGFTERGLRLNRELNGSRQGTDASKIPNSQLAT